MSYHHESAERDYILSVLVQNNSGVLQRIAGLFSRRGYNIQSIVAAKTKDEMHSHILIVVRGDDRIVRQVDKQLSKLVEIENVSVLDDREAVVREHLLMKIGRTDENSEKLISIANVFHANILNVTSDTIIVELTGTPKTLDSFEECYRPYNIIKILRTGTMAMEL